MKGKKLDSVPPVPEACSKREAEHFLKIASDLLEKGALYENKIYEILELASTEVWRENVVNRRKRLLKILELEESVSPDLNLKDPKVFAARVDSYLSAAKTVKEAFEMADRDYKIIYGEHRYSNYHSYRNSRRERENNKCKNLA